MSTPNFRSFVLLIWGFEYTDLNRSSWEDEMAGVATPHHRIELDRGVAAITTLPYEEVPPLFVQFTKASKATASTAVQQVRLINNSSGSQGLLRV